MTESASDSEGISILQDAHPDFQIPGEYSYDLKKLGHARSPYPWLRRFLVTSLVLIAISWVGLIAWLWFSSASSYLQPLIALGLIMGLIKGYHSRIIAVRSMKVVCKNDALILKSKPGFKNVWETYIFYEDIEDMKWHQRFIEVKYAGLKSPWILMPKDWAEKLKSQVARHKASVESPLFLKSSRQLILFAVVLVSLFPILFCMIYLGVIRTSWMSGYGLLLVFPSILVPMLSIYIYSILVPTDFSKLSLNEKSLRYYGEDGTCKECNWEDIQVIRPRRWGMEIVMDFGAPYDKESIVVRGFFSHQVEQVISAHEAWKFRKLDGVKQD